MTAQRVVEAVSWLAERDGRSFVKYPCPSSGRLKDGVLDTNKILNHKELVQSLWTFHEAPRLNEAIMVDAMSQIFDKFYESWKLGPADKQSWVDTISLRCRLLYSMVKGNYKKNDKIPAWILKLELPGVCEQADAPTQEKKESVEPADAPTPEEEGVVQAGDPTAYTIGFIENKAIAFRVCNLADSVFRTQHVLMQVVFAIVLKLVFSMFQIFKLRGLPHFSLGVLCPTTHQGGPAPTLTRGPLPHHPEGGLAPGGRAPV